MKYYIPTSSLNLDNILQAECISPQSFYAQRKTGYKSIELIDEVKKYDQIVLFNHPISFSIDDPGRYNYPLLIEIEDDTQLHNVYNVDNSEMYLCGHTIYLSPQNCRFYFFSEKAYNITTINTKDNKSIKYYEKYIINPSTSSLKLNPLKIETITAGSVYQSNEITIDKQKGICYAFFQGQLLSVTPDLAHQLRLTQELYNILTGIISNPQKKEDFLDKIEPLLKEYKEIDPIELNNKEKFEAKFDGDLGKFKRFKSYFKAILEKWGVWNLVYRTLSQKWGCDLLPNIEDLSLSHDFSKLRTKIEERTSEALKEYQKTQQPPSLKTISINNDIVEIKDTPIINQTINYIISNQLTVSTLSANRKGVCEKLIKEVVIEEIKKVKGETYWDSSIEQKYFNTLYAHIGDLGKPFNLKEIDNPELIAIAAFLLRGHDINALMTYLKSNEVHNYRNVLVLWGALCGYMEMNKEFLSDTLTLDNYKCIYECLFHKPMGELKPDENIPIVEAEKITKSKLDEKATVEKSESSLLEQELSQFEEFTSRTDEIKKEIITALNEIGISSLADWDQKQVNSIKWSTSKGQVKLMKAIAKSKVKNNPKAKVKSVQQQEPTLFDPSLSSEKEFYLDDNAFIYIESILPNDEEKKKVKKEIGWIQKVHKENGYKKKTGEWIDLKEHSNKEVIKHFENNSKSRLDKNILDKVVSKLKELYL